MYNRKSYLIAFLVSILLSLISFGYIDQKSALLSNYWGSDYIAEIYQHSYSIDKFFIQISFLSFYFIFSSLILLIFNFKKKILVYTFIILTLLIFTLTHISMNFAPTDNNLSAIGAFDLGK